MAFNKLYSLFVVLGLTIAVSTLIKSIEEIKKILICFSASGFLLFLLLIVTNQLFVNERLGESLFGNANVFALVIMLALMCSTWLVVYNEGFIKYVFFIFLATEAYMLFLSGGRKYVLVSALFIYLLLILKKDKKGKSKQIQYTVLFMIIVAIGYWSIINIPQLYNTVGYRMEGLFSLFTGERQNKLHEDMVRQNMIVLGLEFFAQRPALGYGMDNYTLLFGEAFGRYTYSHNNVIEMLVNYGVLGLVAYYSFYVFLIYKLWIIKVDETKIRDFFLAFMICLIPLEMGIVSYNMYFVHIFISLVSVLLHMRQVKENRNGAFIRNAK
jgi:O-antigen ligase